MVSKVYDVIVVGAGPAGITAANLLAGKGFDTLLVDQGTQQMLQLPETFYGISSDLLARLDIEEKVRMAVAAPKPIRLISANDNFIYQIGIEPSRKTSSLYGMSLNRAILELVLIERAVGRGATYLQTTVVEDFIFADDRLTGVKCHTPDGYVEYGARVVIEARGKVTPLVHRLGLRQEGKPLDEHVAVFSQFIGSSFTEAIPDNGLLTITLDHGYVLAMPLPKERVSVMVVLQGKKASQDSSNLDKLFQEAVNCWEPLAKAIQAAEKVTPTLPVMNHNWEYERFSGNGFLVVGDAVAFLDPFTCNGVAIGMNGGEIAADFVAQGLAKGSGWPGVEQLSSYDQQIRALIDKWKRVWGIENLSLSSMGLLKQSLGLLSQLHSLKLRAVNEGWKQNTPVLATKT